MLCAYDCYVNDMSFENENPFVPAPPNGVRAKVTQELTELYEISAMTDSRLENIDHTQIKIPSLVPIEQLFNNFMDSPDVLEMDDLESDNESIDIPLVSLFLDSDDELDDGEVLNELDEYGNAGNFYPNRIINSIDGDDLAFPCMIGFRKFVASFYPFLPMNIITRKAYNTKMVEGFESTGRNLVAIVRDVYVFVGSFPYVTDFVVLEDIREFIISDTAKVLMGRPFRYVTQLEYDRVKGLILFTGIFDTYNFWMPHTIPKLKNFEWSKAPPILVLSQRDLMSELKYSYEKTKLMYKNCLNLGLEYQVDDGMKEWLIRGHVSIEGVT
nr:homeodomain-like protein [Tanacetum cinerariifolium]